MEAPTNTCKARRRLGRSVLAIVLAVGVVGASATTAHAGTYAVNECLLTGSASAPDAVYTTNGSLAFTPTNSCSDPFQGLAIGTAGIGYTGPLHAAWTIYAPPGAFLNTAQLQRNSRAGGTYAPIVSVCTAGGSCNGYSNNTGGDWAGTQFGPGGWAYLSVFIGCGSSTCNAGGYIYVREIVLTVNDVTAPVIGSLGGSLVAGGAKSGVETLTVGAADQGGGVRRLAVKVNGTQIASRVLGCAFDSNGVASRVRPCGSAQESFNVNTETAAWSEGANTLEVCVDDYAAGAPPNQRCAARTVVIDNSCPSSAGAAQASSLVAGLQKQGPTRQTVTVPSTRGATVRGALASAAAPVGGANVCLYEQIDVPGDIAQLAAVTKTKSDGSFAVQVTPGPSRSFVVAYRYSNELVKSDSLYLNSKVRPSLRLRAKRKLRNGQNVGFRGAIPGPNADGRAIALQARVGKKWRTFKQIKVNSKGRFKGRYKFTNTRGRVLYRFRARVKRQGNYPYSPGSSKVRKVLVRG
ncbi:hypothetical protein BH20ACT15_BH20ACT15_03600 [soil metagenome]